jgi:hypothetical protein
MAVGFSIKGWDFKNWRGILTSNLNRSRWIRWCEAHWWNEWRCTLCLRWCHGQAVGALFPRVIGHDSLGSNPKRRWGSLRLLLEAKTWRGTAPRRLTAAASLLQAWTMVSGGSGAPPASRSSSMSFSWPSLASRLVQWLNWRRKTWIWWRLMFGGFRALWAKIPAMGCAIYRGF